MGIKNKIAAVVLCHQRPEMLWHCLDFLVKECTRSTDILIVEDRGGDPDNVRVAASFQRPGLSFYRLPEHRWWKCTYAALRALKLAVDADRYKRIFLIEDDILMMPGSFEWHMRQTGWCALSRRVPKYGYERTTNYTVLGSSYPESSVREIVEHLKAEYVGNLKGYLDSVWPEYASRKNPQFDGLVWRMAQGKKVDIPKENLCRHIGRYGSNTGNWESRPTGSVEENIRAVDLTDYYPWGCAQ